MVTYETNAIINIMSFVSYIMFDVLADHRKNLLIQMYRVELQVGLRIS